MPNPILAPKINSTDESILIIHSRIQVGQHVRCKDVLFEIETTKATIELTSDHEGTILAVLCSEGEQVPVGQVLAWVGSSPGEAIPEIRPPVVNPTDISTELRTGLKSRLATLKRLNAPKGDLAQDCTNEPGGNSEPKAPPSNTSEEAPHSYPANNLLPLTGPEKGMADNVLWHRDVPVPAYLEIVFDQAAWANTSKAFARSHRLLLDPMLALMSFQLVQLVRQTKRLNATLLHSRRLEYPSVHMGLAVETPRGLFLVVVREAEKLSAIEFSRRVAALQRAALKGTLHEDEVSGATVGFTSLAKHGVSRHIPILPPSTALIVSHSAPLFFQHSEVDGAIPCVLGATYDHRILDGAQIAKCLNELSIPREALLS